MQMENINQEKPLLSFEFADSTGKIQPLTFIKPKKVITTHRIEEVLSCFEHIQAAVEDGYYAAGFLSYESAPAFDAAYKVHGQTSMPLLWFGIFSEPVKTELHSHGSYQLTNWEPSVDSEEYRVAIQAIRNAIENGDTYQTNYTIRLSSDFQGDAVAFFETLKRAQSSNYCAYINTGEQHILSASPELFFHLKNDKITTKPMKGTVKRGNSAAEDQENARWLYHSEKNRAENIMIVDLLRNDLNRIAKFGTVKVPKLFEIEQYPTVHQMTSTITAEVPDNLPFVDLFKALFPCGSITGAPKISTMEIIADLESAPRNVYCGAIGYFTPDKEAIFNVPIRTVVIDEAGKAVYGVGGGITWDSTAADEYHEVLAKSRLLEAKMPKFHLLESLLLEDGEFFLLDEHLQRLQSSAQYFRFTCRLDEVQKALQNIAEKHRVGKWKIRLLVAQNGTLETEAQSLATTKTPIKVALADEPLHKNNPFLYHKTTNRSIYTAVQKKHQDVFDVLLWNEDGELTEFTNGNVVLKLDGTLWTPPISSGLLSGTFRERLIKEGTIHEKRLTIADLEKCTDIWFINSVRKWLKVQLV